MEQAEGEKDIFDFNRFPLKESTVDVVIQEPLCAGFETRDQLSFLQRHNIRCQNHFQKHPKLSLHA